MRPEGFKDSRPLWFPQRLPYRQYRVWSGVSPAGTEFLSSLRELPAAIWLTQGPTLRAWRIAMIAPDQDAFGVDLEWYATDSAGFIGYFTTGGSALIPRIESETLRSTSEIMDGYLPMLRSVGEPNVNPVALSRGRRGSVSEDPLFYIRSWTERAEKGFYCYDALDVTRARSPYIVIAWPKVALRIDHLPGAIAALVSAIRLPLPFSVAREIDLARVTPILMRTTETGDSTRRNLRCDGVG